MTSDADRRQLLSLARAAIVAHVTGAPLPELQDDQVLTRLGGAFVSIHSHGSLLGCIGHIEANEPLGAIIVGCAVAACSADPRFPAVDGSELPLLDVELSLLGALESISDPADIEVGRHGLLVEKGRSRGLLLPQVATERRWDRETFLIETCRKAGLPGGGWKQGAAIWRFEAEVFGEGTT